MKLLELVKEGHNVNTIYNGILIVSLQEVCLARSKMGRSNAIANRTICLQKGCNMVCYLHNSSVHRGEFSKIVAVVQILKAHL